ncbi:hypothetical protein P5W99_25695 [Paraburkholderia sp. A3BS-1L]
MGVALNYAAPTEVFNWLSSISAFSSIWTWGIILLAHIGFRRNASRKEVQTSAVRMPLFPISSYVAGAFLIAVLVVMAFNPGMRVALVVGPSWIGLLVVFYYARIVRRLPSEQTAG